MKSRYQGFLAGLLVCVQAGVSQAGIYNFAEAREPWTDLDKFRATVLTLRDIYDIAPQRKLDPHKKFIKRTDYENPLVQRHLLVMYLNDRAAWSKLPLEQQLNLSAYLLRCGAAAEAKDLLAPLAEKHPENFLILANLASAWFGIGEPGRARSYQEQALAAWPERYDDLQEKLEKSKDETLKAFFAKNWNQGEHEYYRPSEEVFLKLIKLREAERDRGKEVDTIDALFTDGAGAALRFVNEAGEYDPPNLAKAERAKLPQNYLEIAQQLLLWLPQDNRLFWLFAELAAVTPERKGTLKVAKTILLQDLEKHKAAREHQAVMRRVATPGDVPDATLSDLEKTLGDLEQGRPEVPWQHLALSFFIGAAVALFGYWQFREIRRRHQRVSTTQEIK